MAKISKFDAAQYLDSPEVVAAYLNEAFESGDGAFITAAIGDVAKAAGMSKISKDTGLARESLYKALGGSAKPEFETIRKVLNSFGMKLVVEPIARAA